MTSLILDQPDVAAPERSRRLQFDGSGAERIWILNGRSGRGFEGGGDEPELSLKWVPKGSAEYKSANARFRVSDRAQLLLNRGQPYRLRTAPGSETFVMFFSRGLADAAWQSLKGELQAFPEVPSVAGRSQTALQHSLETLRQEARSDAPDGDRLNERSLAVLSEIAALAAERRGQADRIPALRNTTRQELLRRLARAQSYLLESGAAATLEGAADAAALSPFHLIRVFRAAFGETPLAYGAGKRLDFARDALVMTEDSIDEISRRSGYDSRTAFDRAFRRRFKSTPGALRSKL
ncbi:MAG: helix-turn-helix transcriptional regulator [Proteobacteria bacterium]|nr:helix-turn-helix transcriptional regulator [Pseudomonadota bacterium]